MLSAAGQPNFASPTEAMRILLGYIALYSFTERHLRECRACAAGVQGKKEHKGELWGMCNLFKESLHKVTAQEIFANERPDVHYHLRQMDTQEFGKPSPALHMGSEHIVSSLLPTSRVILPTAGPQQQFLEAL